MKKAQITIFMIVGIVILLTIATIVYLNKLSVKEQPKLEPYPVPAEFSVVNDVFENCIEDLGKKAFIKLGTQGGYINPEDAGFYSIQNQQTTSNAIELFPGSNKLIPYWRHMRSSNACDLCTFDSSMPLLEGGYFSIEGQVEDFIETNIDDCLDFSHLEQSLEVVLKGEPEIDVLINEKDVFIELVYFADINDLAAPERSIEVNVYSTNLDLYFKRVYELAKDLFLEVALDDTQAILEKFTIDMINYYGGIDTSIPPLYGKVDTSLSSPKIWLKQDVQEELKNIISDNIKFNRVAGSFGYSLLYSDNEVLNNIVNNYLIRLTIAEPDSIIRTEIDIEYLPWWDFYLNINPSSGSLIMPDVARFSKLIPMMMKNYKFSYDISYPVLITLRDVESFDGNGYTLQFAYEVNVRNNQPLMEINATLDDDVEEERLSFDDLSNRNSGMIKVKTIEGVSNSYLDEVMVSYTCLGNSIFLGNSLMQDNEAFSEGNLPICLNGFVSGFKEGYYSEPLMLTTELDKEEVLTLELYPVKTFTAKIKKMALQKSSTLEGELASWDLATNSIGYMPSDEQVTLVINRVSESTNAEPLMSYNSILGSQEEFSIDLTVGKYSIDGMLMKQFGEDYSMTEFVIPDIEKCYDGECFMLNGTTFNTSMFLGGVAFDETTGYFEILPEDMLKDSLTFYVYGANINDIVDLEDLGNVVVDPQYTINNFNSLHPKFE